MIKLFQGDPLSEIKTIYFDESGFTGTDLLNPEQPHFCVVSSDIDDAVAQKILHSSFPHYQGKEFKFNNLWRRPTNREGFTAFAKNLHDLSENIFIHLNDKKFVALSKIVDFLVEPVVSGAGYDFYADGFNRHYLNMFHYGLILFDEKNLYDDLVENYCQFSRFPTEEALNHLQVELRKMSETCSDELTPYIGSASLGANSFHQHSNLDTFGSSNDIQLTSVLASIAYWRSKSDLDFAVIHDQSSNLFKQLGTWEKITSVDTPKGVILDGQGEPVQYPLRIVSTELVDSKEHWTIQLCDMFAGMALRRLSQKNTLEEKEFIESWCSGGIENIIFNGIRPEPDFGNGGPKRNSGPDSVDQFTEIVFRK